MKLKFKNLLTGMSFVALLVCSTSAVGQNKSKIERDENAKIKISLNAYSFTKPLLNYAKDRGNGDNRMTLFELMDWAAEQGFDAVDLTAYFFPGYPDVPSDEFINKVKRYAFQLGLDISGTGVRNDFADPDPAKRAADVEHVKAWIDVAVKLGAPVIRVFSGPIPQGYENRREEIANYMAESLKACAEYGKQKGVLVGVQNHGDFLSTADQCIDMVKRVDSEWFGIINDTGYFMTQDPYVDIEKVMPYTVNFQLKESVFGAKSKVKIDLNRIMDILKKSHYRGYVPIETLSPVGGNKKKKAMASVSENDRDSSRKSGGASSKRGSKMSQERNSDTERVKAPRPDYDPYAVVPVFLKQVKTAQNAAFGQL